MDRHYSIEIRLLELESARLRKEFAGSQFMRVMIAVDTAIRRFALKLFED